MAPTLEILRVTGTDLYRKEGAKSVQGMIDILASADGALGSYIGTEIQDPDSWWLVVVWETKQHHQNLIDNKEVYPKLLESLFHGATKIDFMNHVVVAPNDPWAALDAAVTEIEFFKLREGADKKELADVLGEFITKVINTPGAYSGGWAPTAEDDTKFGVVLGWDSIEEYKSKIGGAWVGEYVEKLKTLADFAPRHITLKKQ